MKSIEIDALKKKLDRGDHFRLVEVQPEAHYRARHLPGAVQLPPDRLRESAPELLPNPDEEIILYCDGPDCPDSEQAARVLEELGYADVKRFAGGKAAWEGAGYAFEGNRDGATE